MSILCFGSFQLFSIFHCYKQHCDAYAFSYIFGQSIIISLKLIARSRIAECDRNWGLAHQYLIQPPPWMPSYMVYKPKCYNLTSTELRSAGILDIIQMLLWDALCGTWIQNFRMENRLKAFTSETISDWQKWQESITPRATASHFDKLSLVTSSTVCGWELAWKLNLEFLAVLIVL